MKLQLSDSLTTTYKYKYNYILLEIHSGIYLRIGTPYSGIVLIPHTAEYSTSILVRSNGMWLTAGVWVRRCARSSGGRGTEAGRGSSGPGCAASASRGLAGETGAAATRARVCLLALAAAAQAASAPTRLSSPPPRQLRPRTTAEENGAIAAPSASAPLGLCGTKKNILFYLLGKTKSMLYRICSIQSNFENIIFLV